MTPGEGMTPPHSMDAEAAVLSAAMVNPEAMGPLVVTGLLPEEFYSEAHRRVFEACKDLHGRGQPVDVLQVGQWLRDRGRIAQVGGMAYLTEILNAAPVVTRDSVEAYARTVREKARLRAIIATCQRIAAEGYLEVTDVAKFIDGAEQAIYAISRSAVTRARLVPIGDIIRQRAATWAAAYTSGQAKAVGVANAMRAL